MRLNQRPVVCAGVFRLVLLAALCAAQPCMRSANAQADNGNFLTSWAAPTVTPNKPLVIRTTILVNGKPVTKEVEVNGIKRWVDPPSANYPTIDAWYDARVKAMTDASKAKADLIVAAINQAFAQEFMQIGEMAKLDTPIKRKLRAYNNKETELSVISLPSVQPPDPKNIDPKTKQPFYTRENSPMWFLKDPAGESGGGGTFIPNSPGGKGLGFMGIMGAEDRNVTTVATGFDLDGLPSVINFGIENRYVAEFSPRTGMTDEEVLEELERMLDYNGLPATYDALLKELFFDSPLMPGDTFTWGNNDPGLSFFVGIGAVETVPEPATLVLAGMGLLLMAAAYRRANGSMAWRWRISRQ